MTVDGALPGVQNMADDLVERAGAGSVAAFEALVRRHDRRMLALAWRLTGQLVDAQDIIQDALSRLHANLHRFQSEDEVGPWLRTVTVNLCRDLARRKRRSPVVAGEELISQAAAEANPEEEASGQQREEILRSALQRLTAKERTALVLRELEGMTTAEVAKITGVAEATVRVQILHARLKLRKLLSGRLERERRRETE
jgi:RNA polymerase sigma-70 factor (ECF subfamily)